MVWIRELVTDIEVPIATTAVLLRILLGFCRSGAGKPKRGSLCWRNDTLSGYRCWRDFLVWILVVEDRIICHIKVSWVELLR